MTCSIIKVVQITTLVCLSIVLTFDSARADVSSYSESVYGGIGLIETPTARFSNDGEFLFGVSADSPNNRLYSKMQFLPWMEAVLRYTEGTYKPYFDDSKQTWKDKGLDLKFRLFQETDFIPEIAIGIRDLGGTGRYSAEYIVASKKVSYVDFSLGLGWGNLNGKNDFSNPLKYLTSESRGGTQDGYGGLLNLKNYFSGPDVSLFGGLEIQTPIKNLSVKAEYDSSDYTRYIGSEKNFFKTGDIFELDSRFNYSINYKLQPRPNEKIDLSLGFVRGNTIIMNLSASSNLNTMNVLKYKTPKENLAKPKLKPYEELNDDWKKYLAERIIWQMGNEGFVTHNLIFNDDELQAEISQGRFLKPIQAIDLASRILANNSPKNITDITIINLDQGIETYRSTIKREKLVQLVSRGSLQEKDIELIPFQDPLGESITIPNEYLYPNFFWNVKPTLGGTIQHQQKFFFYQLQALFHAEYAIKKGLLISADFGLNIDNNFEDYTYHIPDGNLHHVRQDRRLYLIEGESGLRRLVIDQTKQIGPNIITRVTAGYFESMFGGIGGEILYLPDSKKWGISFDTYLLKQRDFDQKLGFQDYETVTGFMNFFYDLPIYNMRLKLSAGKFLGKDNGVNIDVSRRFSSGARVGASASLTDCNPACVGEGSFNKWIYFELPMEMFYINRTTRSKAGYAWSPLTKDAGTRVSNGNLFALVTNAKDEISSYETTPWSFKKILSGFSVKEKKIQ